MPLRGRVSDSDGLLPRPRTPGRVWPRKALRMAYTASEEFRRGATHLRSGEGPRRPPRECGDTHGRKSHFDLRPALGMGFNRPITAEGAKLPGPAAAASGGLPDRSEELTRIGEIPGKPGGSASTWGPGRTGPRRNDLTAGAKTSRLPLQGRAGPGQLNRPITIIWVTGRTGVTHRIPGS